MKFRILTGLFLLASVFACHKPVMKLPVNDNPGPGDINDVSPVYIFLEIHDKDTVARLNKNQVLTTTHWVVHIDRRLPLKSLVEHMHTLYVKRHKKSIHSKPGTRMFLSHIDTLRQRMSLDDITQVEVKSPFYTSRRYVRQYPKILHGRPAVHLDLHPGGTLDVDSLRFLFPRDKRAVAQYLDNLSGDRQPRMLFLNADYNVRYGRFNDLYGFVLHRDSTLFRTAPIWFWYNPRDLNKP
jgi:hypothetical protein